MFHSPASPSPGFPASPGELPFKSTSGSAASDAAFVELLARAAAAAVPAAGSKAKRPGTAQIGRLRLAETDVAKVREGGREGNE